MRPNRHTAIMEFSRVFLPWDTLQLDTEIDSVFNVRKNEIHIQIFRTLKKQLIWSPIYHKNLGIFYDETQELEKILITIAKQIQNTCFESITMEFYDIGKQLTEFEKALDDNFSCFRYHPYEKSFEGFIDDLIDYRQKIRDKARKQNIIEPGRKRLQMIFCNVDSDSALFLKNNEDYRRKFISLLRESNRERMVLVPYSETVTNWTKGCLQSLDYAIFIHDANSKFVREVLYPDMQVWIKDPYQLEVGTVYMRESKRLMPANYNKYTINELGQQRKNDRDRVEQEYRDYLASLEEK